MDKQDVTCGELLNETEEELKIIIKFFYNRSYKGRKRNSFVLD